MPVKRRRPKRHLDPQAELEAWSGVFEVYYDYFNELDDWGISHPVGAWLPEPATEEKFMEAARDAWQRLGASFMATWQPTDVREKPWALDQFGEPPYR